MTTTEQEIAIQTTSASTSSTDSKCSSGCTGCPNKDTCSQAIQEPEHCPGPSAENAGKESACAGCPHRAMCSSGAGRRVDPDLELINQKLASVKHKIVVLSGKGGVGKSTFSSQLAYALSEKGFEVGLMDIDICGPSLPRMLGVQGESVHSSASGLCPVYVTDRLAVMSIGFLLEQQDAAVIWRGPKKNGMIKQFLKDVEWGELDYLVVDTPPGTSDEHLSIISYLKASNPDGAIIVTSPQEVALNAVRKEINFCFKTSLPVLGVVENMSGFICPCCQKESIVFPKTTGGGEEMSKSQHVPFLGRVPLDPLIARSCDDGKPFFLTYPDAPATKALLKTFDAILEKLPKETKSETT